MVRTGGGEMREPEIGKIGDFFVHHVHNLYEEVFSPDGEGHMVHLPCPVPGCQYGYRGEIYSVKVSPALDATWPDFKVAKGNRPVRTTSWQRMKKVAGNNIIYWWAREV
jgi:hypothetical protein